MKILCASHAYLSTHASTPLLQRSHPDHKHPITATQDALAQHHITPELSSRGLAARHTRIGTTLRERSGNMQSLPAILTLTLKRNLCLPLASTSPSQKASLKYNTTPTVPPTPGQGTSSSTTDLDILVSRAGRARAQGGREISDGMLATYQGSPNHSDSGARNGFSTPPTDERRTSAPFSAWVTFTQSTSQRGKAVRRFTSCFF